MDEVEDGIEVDDLPNFRFESATQFDVDSSSGIQPTPAEAAHYDLPDVIRLFLVYFQKNLRDRNVYEVHSIYENSFNKLTDRYYKNAPWPPAEAIAPLVDNDEQFLLLYKELYYRHIYSKLQPTLEQRFESWSNYTDIFNLLLSVETPLELELPNQWLWDIIDEFIYQFQAFCQFRQRVKNKSEEELRLLSEAKQVWSVHKVLYYLHALADKSEIEATLEGQLASSSFARANLYKMVGYFSLIGLLRMHCLMADYRLALQTVQRIDLSKKGLFTRVTACHISIFYYVGFSYLMSRRYVDAIKTFSSILFYIGRTKQYHTRSYQYDQILKKNEQMYALLSMCISLCPQQIDDNLASTLKEKFGDRMQRMQSNNVDVSAFEELFSFACPKFISPSPLDYDKLPANHNPQEAYRLQLRLFLQEVQQQKVLPTIRSFLKLYTTIGIPKLAALLEETDEGSFREHLQCLKHKTHSLVWSGGAPLSGCSVSVTDVDFYVEHEMAHVADSALTRRHSDYFIKQINKLEEIICNLQPKA